MSEKRRVVLYINNLFGPETLFAVRGFLSDDNQGARLFITSAQYLNLDRPDFGYANTFSLAEVEDDEWRKLLSGTVSFAPGAVMCIDYP